MGNMWMVRAEGGTLAPEWQKNGVISLGWLPDDDVTSSTSDEIKLLFERDAGGPLNRSRMTGFNQFKKFALDFSIGDEVLVYDASSRKYHVGTITSDLEYDLNSSLEADGPHRHIRHVEWKAEVDRDSLSTSAKNSLGAIMTLFSVNPDVQEEITALIEGRSPLVSTSEEIAIDEKINFEAIAENARELVKDAILRLDWKGMQELVAGLLRALGYKTRVSSAGPDRGKDVIASPDGLGLENPRVIIEVKHRKQQMGASDIRAFSGGLRSSETGLYVSTGGFSKEAHYEAERTQIPITLLDLGDFAELLIKNYDATDIETRTLLPLKQIYYPYSL